MGILGRFFKGGERSEDKRVKDDGYGSSRNAEELYNKGVEFIQQSDWKNAIVQFEKSIKINPRSANCWYALGISLIKMNPGDTNENETRELGMRAAAAFKTAVELSDIDQSLKPDHYHLACRSAAAMYKAEKQYAVAVE
jgi:tetratricopeptide (TPR) repeat protein